MQQVQEHRQTHTISHLYAELTCVWNHVFPAGFDVARWPPHRPRTGGGGGGNAMATAAAASFKLHTNISS